MKVLYASEEVRRAIRRTFRKGGGRRVAVVAFVGAGAEAYLPNPKGLELYCWPSPSGTTAGELRRLRRRGVHLYFAERLHMKVYWSARRGTVITSANLSTNAFGSGGLKECGVYLPSETVDIDKIIRSLRATRATPAAIEKLEREQHKIERHDRRDPATPTFSRWYDQRPRRHWSLRCYEGWVPASRALRAAAKKDRPDGKLADWLNVKRGEARSDDFVLCYRLARKRPTAPHWFFVHRVVRMSRKDRAYESGFSHQAGQVYPARACPPAPFRIDTRFRRALSAAWNALGPSMADRLLGRPGRPSARVLRMLRELY